MFSPAVLTRYIHLQVIDSRFRGAFDGSVTFENAKASKVASLGIGLPVIFPLWLGVLPDPSCCLSQLGPERRVRICPRGSPGLLVLHFLSVGIALR